MLGDANNAFNWYNYLPTAPSGAVSKFSAPPITPIQIAPAAPDTGASPLAINPADAFKMLPIKGDWAQKLADQQAKAAQPDPSTVKPVDPAATPAEPIPPRDPSATTAPTTPQATPALTQVMPGNTTRLGALVNDQPLDAVAKLNLQYTAGPSFSDPNMLAYGSAALVKPIAQVLANGGPGADAILDTIAKLAWFRQGEGKYGVPEAAPKEYVQQWKDAYRRGQTVTFGPELNAQLAQQGVDVPTMLLKLNPATATPVQPTLAPAPASSTSSSRYGPGTQDGMYRPGSGPNVNDDGVYRPGSNPNLERVNFSAQNYPIQDDGVFRPSTYSPEQIEYVRYAVDAAQRNGVDPRIFLRQLAQENGFKARGGSPAGAQGIAQIVPQYHPGVDVNNPWESMDYAANLMSKLLTKYQGNYALALAAYNAGEGNVDSGDYLEFPETQQYLRIILPPAPTRMV